MTVFYIYKKLVNYAADRNDAIALAMRAENYWFGENTSKRKLPRDEHTLTYIHFPRKQINLNARIIVLKRFI